MTTKTSEYTERKCKMALNSIKNVLRSRDMTKLTKRGYEFCINRLGFIAHYSRDGFIGAYEQLGISAFANALITGESGIHGFNKDHAQMFLDGRFDTSYSKDECENIANTINSIVSEAENYLTENT